MGCRPQCHSWPSSSGDWVWGRLGLPPLALCPRAHLVPTYPQSPASVTRRASVGRVFFIMESSPMSFTVGEVAELSFPLGVVWLQLCWCRRDQSDSRNTWSQTVLADLTTAITGWAGIGACWFSRPALLTNVSTRPKTEVTPAILQPELVVIPVHTPVGPAALGRSPRPPAPTPALLKICLTCSSGAEFCSVHFTRNCEFLEGSSQLRSSSMSGVGRGLPCS